jgi:cytochrome oxidase Cu insertion factor (SCO1/SenC/PrrC family)
MYKKFTALLLILLIFLIPMWSAYWLYYHGHYLIKHTLNHGVLLNPAPRIARLPLRDLQGHVLIQKPFTQQWTLLSITSDPISDTFKKLYTLRQIRLMLGKDMSKVQRVLLFYDVKTPLLFTDSALQPYAGSLLYVVNKKDWELLFANTTLAHNSLIFNGFFIVDPRGNLILSYNPSANPKDMMKDLHRLL